MAHKKSGLSDVLLAVMCRSKRLCALLLFSVVGAIVLALISPLILEQMVNRLTTGQKIAFGFACTYFAVLALSGLLDAAKEMMITVFGQKITHGLRSSMCQKLSRLPAAYFSANEPGKTTSRFVNDVDAVEQLFTNGIVSMCADICKVICTVVIVFLKSTGLGIMIFLTAPLLFALTRMFQKRMLAAQIKNRIAIEKVNNFIPETIGNIRMIRSFSKQKYMEQRYDNSIEESYRAMEKSNLYDSIYSPIVMLLSSLVIATVMILSATGGGMQEFFGMSVGTAVAMIAYVGMVFGPIESIGMEIQNIQSAIAGVKRIDALLSEKEANPPDFSVCCDQLIKSHKPCVDFHNVRFSYDGVQPILNGLSLRIEAGENVTLVGRTGAGKSTIFRLLLGLYVPDSGSVRIFGADADRIPNSQKRHLLGYVEQSFHMVPGSVADQISLFDPTIGDEEIENAAKLVGLHESISSLPLGYQTVCRAAAFSQGQLQLLSIARAVVTNPPVMLLDEITAFFDSQTEHSVMAALKRATGGRTVISISHRLYGKMNSKLISIG
ncbi:MAG: ABC transporter ATP-binding protein [Oscillospiraceae bacterium]